MLEKLSIKNYALIDEMEMDFRQGLTIITGETGSGKSILLDALGLLLGSRADSSSLRDKNQKCVLEARFAIEKYALESFFDNYDLDYEPICILRRELSPQGKSRSFINDTPVNLQQLRELGLRLVDIHSQHDSLQLSDSAFLLDLIDGAAGNKSLVLAYRQDFFAWQEISRRLESMQVEQKRLGMEEEFLRFQFNELSELKPAEGEELSLENEMDTLLHADKIKEQLESCSSTLENTDYGALASIYKGLQALQSVAALSRDAGELSERLKSVYIELKDIVSGLQGLSESIEDNPLKLQELEARWDKLNHVMQKHRVNSASELVQLMHEMSQKLEHQLDLGAELLKLKHNQEVLFNTVMSRGIEIHEKRQQVLDGLGTSCLDLLSKLGMPKAQLQFKLEKITIPDKFGISKVQLLFSANAGQEVRELSKVASGGEFSRLMLSLKKILAETADLPTIIFDEIDTGVSGAIADKMGEVLSSLSKHLQVLVITHLPQIAGKGNDHLKVMKWEENNQTISRLCRLESPDRVNEIAAMLSGTELTDAARTHAKSLLGF